MFRILAVTVLLSAMGWITPSFAQVTHAQCDHDYDSCKKKHVFDKKPCKKRRDNCFAQLAQQNATEQKAEVKRRMLDGPVATETPGTSMRDQMNGGATRPMTAAEKKAEAKKRLKARQEANSATTTGTGMRDSMRTQ